MSFILRAALTLTISYLLILFDILVLKYQIVVFMLYLFYIFLNLRNESALLPLYIITIIQGKNFKLSRDLQEIKEFLKGSDKGHMIEELFAMPAWSPILSVESINGKVWEIVKENLLKFKHHLPAKEKLGIIAKKEANLLLEKKEKIDSKIISKSTLKIFLSWMFCENNTPLENEENEDFFEKIKSNTNELKGQRKGSLTFQNTFKANDFDFINKFLTEEFLERMYDNGLQWRREIALKGKGCPIKKMDAVNSMISILKQSKFKDLFDWEQPECFSFIMQPFVISPMINVSDIGVSMKNQLSTVKNYEDFFGYLDHCLFEEHPFPVLERYIKEINTQVFVDLREMKKNFAEKEAAKVLNFGLGIRGCLGKYYAKELLKNFFEDMIKEDFFNPMDGHLYSGRSNDKENFFESVYQVNLLIKICYSEIKRNYFSGSKINE